jgi:hypothetical protein
MLIIIIIMYIYLLPQLCSAKVRLAPVLAQSNTMYQLLIFAVGSGRTRAVSLRSERAMSRGFPSLELDTVVEERSDPDPEMTTTEVLMTPDS